MERQSIFKKLTIMMTFFLCLGLLVTGVLFPVKSYADTTATDPTATTYTVAFKIGGQLYDAYLLNYNQTATKPTASGLTPYNWKVSTTGLAYDFTSKITKDIVLELIIPATKVAVLFLQYNEDYVSDTDSSEYYKNRYIGLDVKIVDANTTISSIPAADVPEREGYTFKQWQNNESATTAFDFTTPITTTTIMYPKYELNEYTITFKHYDGTTETRQVKHDYTLNDVPTPIDRANYIANGWYNEDDHTQTLFNFYSGKFHDNETFLASYSAADYLISFASGHTTYGNFGTYSGGTFTEFTTQQYTANGASYACQVKLNSNYNQFSLQQANISRTGSLSAITVEPVAGTTDIYTITLVSVASNIEIAFTGLSLNKYSVSFDYASAQGISVVPKDTLTEGTDYIVSGNSFLVVYGTTFYFTLEMDAKYESRYNLNVSAAIATYNYFTDGTVAWDNYNNSYKVTSNSSNSDIALNVPTVECVTTVFEGLANLNTTGFDSPSFSGPLVKWDSATSTARFIKNRSFYFTAVPIDSNAYHILSTSGITTSGSQYQYFSLADSTVTFEVVEIIFVTIPASITGASTVAGESVIAGSEYISASASWRYKVIKGGTFNISFVFKTEYSDTDVSFSFDAGSPTVDKTDFATTQTVVIKDIYDSCVITINPLQKNRYTIDLLNNDMVMLELADGFMSNTVEYGGNLNIKVTKKTAYSDAEITKDNISITAEKYLSCEVSLETDDDITFYYLIQIKTIVGAFSITVEGLPKNTYPVTMISNEFATLSYSSTTAQYAGDYVFVYTLESAYSQSTVKPENVKILDSSNFNEISTYTINVNTSLKTVTISGVITAIEVYITGLTKNKYTVSAEYFNNFSQFNSNKKSSEELQHGSSFTFTLEFNNPYYTQSIDTIVVQYSINGGDYADLTPVDPENSKPDMKLTFRIPNVNGNIAFNVVPLNINLYTVIFYDTDPVSVIYQYNAVEHGDTISPPTRPTKEGYQCIGWYMSENGTTEYNNFSSGITENLTLYARYNSQTFTVTFHDGVGLDRSYSVSYGKASPIPDPTAKTGYSQSYWVTTGMNLNSVKQDYYVEAVYIIDQYTVRFVYSSEPESGVYDRVLETQTVTYGYKAAEPTSVPVIQGYDFDKWDFAYTTRAIEANTDIHAIFKIKKFNVTFVNVTQGGNLAQYQVNYNTPMVALEPKEVTGVRGKYIFPYYDASGNYIDNHLTTQLGDGYVLEGWYSDADKSVRYNFADSVVKGNVTVYGNMYISKVSVKFYVDGEFYIEKLVEYDTTLTDIPDIPVKAGYTQVAPEWTIVQPTNGTFVSVKNDIRVEAVYTLNKYYVTFKLPTGESIVREIAHGGTVTNVPYPDTDFGEVIVMDSSLLQYVTANTIVYITIIDFLPFLIVAGAAAVLTFIVVSLILAVNNMRRGIKNIKRVEELFRAIKKQDARLTQANEAKLKAEIESKMKEKEKYRRGSFLDD